MANFGKRLILARIYHFKLKQADMKRFMLNLSALMTLLFFSTSALAQFNTPAPSPSSKLVQTVGLTEVTIEYSRPSVKDRTIFGDLRPYDVVWRTGANAATKVSFNKDVKVGNTDLKAGSYALFTLPNKGEWKVMFYNYDTPNSNGYGDKEAVATLSVKPMDAGRLVESMIIDVNNLRNNSATIDILWERTLISIPLAVHTDNQVMAAFKKMQEGPSAGQYYAMGNFMYESGQDLETALKYVQKATKTDNPRFWQVHREALILGKLGKKAEAIKTAKHSLELAKKAENMDYVKMNEKAIKEWSTM